MEKALTDKADAEKQVDEDVVRLQKKVKVFKFMKYRDVYTDGAQGKPPRYHLGAGGLRTDHGTEVLAFMLLQCLSLCHEYNG